MTRPAPDGTASEARIRDAGSRAGPRFLHAAAALSGQSVPPAAMVRAAVINRFAPQPLVRNPTAPARAASFTVRVLGDPVSSMTRDVGRAAMSRTAAGAGVVAVVATGAGTGHVQFKLGGRAALAAASLVIPLGNTVLGATFRAAG